MRLRPAGHRDHRPEHPAGRCRLRYRRRRRSHVKGGHLLPALRSGARMGDAKAIDAMVAVLTDPFGVGPWVSLLKTWLPSTASPRRAGCLAVESQRRAAAAIDAGHFKSPDRPDRQADPQGRRGVRHRRAPEARHDHGVAGQDEAGLQKDGTVTPVTPPASTMALLSSCWLMRQAAAAGRSRSPAWSYAVAGVPERHHGRRPDPGDRWPQEAGLTLDQMDVIESNEAFAAQALSVPRCSAWIRPRPTRTAAPSPSATRSVARRLHRDKAIYEMNRIGGKYCLVTMYRWRPGYRGDFRARLIASSFQDSESPPAQSGGFLAPRCMVLHLNGCNLGRTKANSRRLICRDFHRWHGS